MESFDRYYCLQDTAEAVGDPVETASGLENFWFFSNTDGQ